MDDGSEPQDDDEPRLFKGPVEGNRPTYNIYFDRPWSARLVRIKVTAPKGEDVGCYVRLEFTGIA